MINLIIFFLGISVGSFLNVLVDRIPRNESFLKGRSHCDFCNKTLKWYDLIPLLSFILVKGKCRYCHKKLSFQYFFMELLTGILYVDIYLFFLPAGLIPMVFYLILISGLISLGMMDYRYGILADKIIFPLIVLNLIILIYQYMSITYNLAIVIQKIIVACLAGLLFLLLAVITKGKGMGGGDIKLVFLMGLILGFPGIITALYLAFVSGGIIGLILLGLKKKKAKETIPFGPFLIGATILTIFFGNQIWLWYSQKFLGW